MAPRLTSSLGPAFQTSDEPMVGPKLDELVGIQISLSPLCRLVITMASELIGGPRNARGIDCESYIKSEPFNHFRSIDR
ncbi:hypothetical protein ABIF14_004493 [Bradyrhizobium elkanii]|nr:hypothetical protein [Bradyrhizobium elkanii]